MMNNSIRTNKTHTRRGTMFIEYALILAFVVIAGFMFLADKGLSKDIANIFGTAEATLDQAANGPKLKVTYGEPDYKKIAAALYKDWQTGDKEKTILTLLNKYDGVIRSDNSEAAAEFKQLFPDAFEDGVGNWILTSAETQKGNEINKGYQLTWTLDTDYSNGQVNSIYYSNVGGSGGAHEARLGLGYSTIDSSGQINSATTMGTIGGKASFYTINYSPNNGFNSTYDTVMNNRNNVQY